MISVLLMILKVIGIILLILLGLVILLVALVLFWPFVVKIKGSYGDEDAAPFGVATVSWLFKILFVDVRLDENGLFYKAKILMKTLVTSEEEEEPEKSTADEKPEKVKSEADEKPEKVKPTAGEKPEKAEAKAEKAAEADAVDNSKKLAEEVEKKSFREKVADHRYSKLVTFLLKELVKVLKILKPKKLHLFVRFGTEDGVQTGQVTGYAAFAKGMFNLKDFEFEPVYGEKALTVKGDAKIRFCLFPLIVIALQVWFNDQVRQVILKKPTKVDKKRRKLHKQKMMEAAKSADSLNSAKAENNNKSREV